MIRKLLRWLCYAFLALVVLAFIVAKGQTEGWDAVLFSIALVAAIWGAFAL